MPPRDIDADPKTWYGRILKLGLPALCVFVLYSDSVRPIVANHIKFVEASQVSLEALAVSATQGAELMKQIQKDQRQIQEDQRALTGVVERLMVRLEALERNK